jgi:arsenate reductase (thioredoxin)
VAQADIVVALKPGLDLPHHDGVRYETWPLPDPAEWDIDGIRPLRDYIDTKVQQLLTELPPPAMCRQASSRSSTDMDRAAG